MTSYPNVCLHPFKPFLHLKIPGGKSQVKYGTTASLQEKSLHPCYLSKMTEGYIDGEEQKTDTPSHPHPPNTPLFPGILRPRYPWNPANMESGYE